jgi:hypothetical protein
MFRHYLVYSVLSLCKHLYNIHEILPRKCGIPRFWSPKVESRDSRKTKKNQVPDLVRQQEHSDNLSSDTTLSSLSRSSRNRESIPRNHVIADQWNKSPRKIAVNPVMLLILLPFVLFRRHSGLVRHNLCGARRRVKWCVRKCIGRWAFLHRKSHLRRFLIPRFRQSDCVSFTRGINKSAPLATRRKVANHSPSNSLI